MLSDDHNVLLKSVSRSFYLSIRFLPAEMREPVALGYLLARLTDTVADAEGIRPEDRLEMLDSIRLLIQGQESSIDGLEKLSSSVDHQGEVELLNRQSDLFRWYLSIDEKNRDHLSEVVLTIIHGQLWDATYFNEEGLTCCGTADDLLRYTYWVAGCVGEFWTKVGFTNLGGKFASPDDAGAMLMSGRKLGQALQLVNILRDLHEDLPAGRCYLPEDALRAAGWDGSGVPGSGQFAPAIQHWTKLCRGFLEESDSYLRMVQSGRARFCTRLPRLLAEKTLNSLENAGVEKVLQSRIKVSRNSVRQSVLEAIFL